MYETKTDRATKLMGTLAQLFAFQSSASSACFYAYNPVHPTGRSLVYNVLLFIYKSAREKNSALAPEHPMAASFDGDYIASRAAIDWRIK